MHRRQMTSKSGARAARAAVRRVRRPQAGLCMSVAWSAGSVCGAAIVAMCLLGMTTVHADSSLSTTSASAAAAAATAGARATNLTAMAASSVVAASSSSLFALRGARRILGGVSDADFDLVTGPSPGILMGVGLVSLVVAVALSVLAWQQRKSRTAAALDSNIMHGVWKVGMEGKRGKGRRKYSSSVTDDKAVPYLSYNEVQVATNGFAAEGVVNETGHSSVHRAEGPNGQLWAVKRTRQTVKRDAEHLFRNEVDFVSQLCHTHVLPLVAACDDNGEQILVFDYMPNGSLASWLRPPSHDAEHTNASANTVQQRYPLSFNTRLSIAVGVAEALRYLHSFSKPTIIHRDVSTDAVLLDDRLHPRLAGLGLLKHLPGEGLRSRMAGRKGYLDPEYFQTFKVTTKCDVYAFGVVLLEMLTGVEPIIQPGQLRSQQAAAAQRQPAAAAAGAAVAAASPVGSKRVIAAGSETTEVDEGPQQPTTLAQWALHAIEEGKLRQIIDPRMLVAAPPPQWDALETFAAIAAACVAPLRKDRPEMAKVAFLLAELKRPGSAAEAAGANAGAAAVAGGAGPGARAVGGKGTSSRKGIGRAVSVFANLRRGGGNRQHKVTPIAIPP